MLADHQQGRAVSFETTYPLTIGEIYPVVGMTIAEREFYFLVQDDSEGPCFAHAGFFELFVANIPSGWRFALEPGVNASGRELWSQPGVATWGYPNLVDDPNYINALFELDAAALTIFRSHVAAAALAS